MKHNFSSYCTKLSNIDKLIFIKHWLHVWLPVCSPRLVQVGQHEPHDRVEGVPLAPASVPHPLSAGLQEPRQEPRPLLAALLRGAPLAEVGELLERQHTAPAHCL